MWRDKPQSWTPALELMATLVEVMSHGQIRPDRPGQRAANVVSIADFAKGRANHMRGGE